MTRNVAILALEDGKIFRGRSFGAPTEKTGEVVFNTSMTGYQEILTDPSYRGQIVSLTVPEVGNYGVNAEDSQSDRIQAEGLVVRSFTEVPSNWRAEGSLPEYLKDAGIPAISEVDTRALTRHIRSQGAMRGVLAPLGGEEQALVQKARSAPRLKERDLVGEVTCDRPYQEAAWLRPEEEGSVPKIPLVAFDLGMKRNILRRLCSAGFEVTVVPAGTSAEAVLDRKPSAIFLSNGPGDPTAATAVIETTRKLVGRLPIFGICLGHQLLGLALGAKTFKLKFGHRGGNQPVQELSTGKVLITAQNHGYAVDAESLPPELEITHLNLNDRTVEGFRHRELPILAVQYHPEASPGPQDSFPLFTSFREFITPHDVGPGRDTGR